MASPRKNSNSNPLPRLVGYAEVCDALGVSKSTLERMVREGKFPKPVQLAPNRVGWQVDVVTAWLADRSTGLVAHAVTHPEDLEPDQLEDHARDLAARALSKRTGKPVDATDLSLHLTQHITGDDFVALETEEHQFRAAYLAQLPDDEAAVVAATLLPQLRPALMNAASPRAREAMEDPGQLEFDFKLISDFLRLFELQVRLTDDGIQPRTSQTVLERLAEFDEGRAFVLSAWLFPALLPRILQGAKPASREVFSNPDRLRELALAALDDVRWAEKQVGLLARQRKVDHATAPETPPTDVSDKRARPD